MEHDTVAHNSELISTTSHARRNALRAGIALSPLALLAGIKNAQAATSKAFQDITAAANGADPTGVLDSSTAFMTAFNKLPASGGCLYCPAGVYLLKPAVLLSGKSVVIKGDGSLATVFVMAHMGTAFTLAPGSVYASASVVGISITGPSGAGNSATGAISISLPNSNDVGAQSCLIDDVGIGYSPTNLTNGCQILNGLTLQNIWKSRISNVRMFGPFNLKTGTSSTFVTLNGRCIDNKFIDCVADGPSIGYNLLGYAEGLHILSSLIICGVGFTTVSATLMDTRSIIGLYIRGCEFNCVDYTVYLYNIWSGWISDTHFGASSSPSGNAVVTLDGCVNMMMSNNWITGNSAANLYGLNFISGAINQANGLILENLNNGVVFGKGAVSTLVLGLQMVNENVFPHVLTSGVATDNSGNAGFGGCNAQWQTDGGSLKTLY